MNQCTPEVTRYDSPDMNGLPSSERVATLMGLWRYR